MNLREKSTIIEEFIKIILNQDLIKWRSVKCDLYIMKSIKNPLFSRDSFCFGNLSGCDQAGNIVG